jgi:histone-lysine N-methyltransferase SUV39H
VIKKTLNKGWGVFAAGKKIPKNTYIGIYSGELLTDKVGEQRGRYA